MVERPLIFLFFYFLKIDKILVVDWERLFWTRNKVGISLSLSISSFCLMSCYTKVSILNLYTHAPRNGCPFKIDDH